MNPDIKDESQFKRLRGIFFPIHGYELKKFIPMCLILICVVYNSHILNILKEIHISYPPGIDAQYLHFLKIYPPIPIALIFFLTIMGMANIFTREHLFYAVIIPFLLFFGTSFFVFPTLHGKAFISVFYIIADLFGKIALPVIFWNFSNRIHTVNEAKRFYVFYFSIGSLGTFLIALTSPLYMKFIGKITKLTPKIMEIKINILTILLFLSSCIIIGVYYWISRHVLTDARYHHPTEFLQHKTKAELSLLESLKHILKSPYIRLIFLITMSYGVSTHIINTAWREHIALDYAHDLLHFLSLMSILSFFLPFIGQNILWRCKWRTAALVEPILILLSSLPFFFWGNFNEATLILSGLTLFSVRGLGLSKTTEQMTYIPLHHELKLKGQVAVEIMAEPIAKTIGLLLPGFLITLTGRNLIVESPYTLGVIVIGICILWIIATLRLNKRFECLKKENTFPKTICDT